MWVLKSLRDSRMGPVKRVGGGMCWEKREERKINKGDISLRER